MAAFYEQHGRQQSWDQSQGPPPPAGPSDGRWSGRASASSLEASGASPAPSREEGPAFSTQFEEIERAHDNLAKSGRAFGAHSRRDSLPMSGQFARQFPEYDRGQGSHRHHSVGGDFDGVRSNSSHSSSSYTGYLANQRFGPRQSEAEQMLQFKRRAAAQRERDLRNYHQEQQYNRNPKDQSGPKSDRSMSPSAMNEEDRRELIARQHRALYGDGSNLYTGDNTSPRPISQDARVLAAAAASGHGDTYDSFAAPPGTSAEGNAAISAPTGQGSRSRENSMTSKSPGPNTFAMFDANQQANRTSASSPGGSPTRQNSAAPTSSGVAPIGTRPTQQSAGQPKRATPPMPSPLGPGYGFGNNDKSTAGPAERTTSASSNPTSSGAEKPTPNLAWGGNSGPWGSNKNPLGAQTSVWG